MFLIHKLLNIKYIYFPEISRMEDTIEKLRPYFKYKVEGAYNVSLYTTVERSVYLC